MPHRRDSFVCFRHSHGALVRTLPEAFQATVTARPDATALTDFDTGTSYTWREYGVAVEHIACGLAALSVRPGDTVGLLLTNRPEFHLVDTAVMHLRAIPFSIYNTLPPEQINYICSNAAARVIVTEQQFLPLLWRAELAAVRLISVDGAAPGTQSLDHLMRLRNPDFDFDRCWRRVRPDDLATISYTSGTTGPPKGVELTHSNVLAQLVGLGEHLPTGFEDSILSYLPAAHIADRVTAHYAGMARGVRVTSVADPHRIAEALVAVRPTVLFGVPRIWQKAEAAIRTRVESAPDSTKSRTARWALRIAGIRAHRQFDTGRVGLLLRVKHRIAESLVLRTLRRAMGMDRLVFAATGAAPIPRETLEFFFGLGIAITEVWGQSEGTGVSTTTTGPRPALGSVGKPLRGIEMRLAADGEVLLRGPMIMRGYHRDPDRTRQVLDAHRWLRTGDLARVDERGDLHLIGRKSDMIITDAGSNVAPARVEGAVMAESFLIGQVVVVGEGCAYLTALITLDRAAIEADAAAQGTVAADIETLVTRSAIRNRIADAVARANARLARPEQIRRYILLDHVWEPGGPELTPKMSLRRDVIARRYARTIDSLYDEPPGAEVVEL